MTVRSPFKPTYGSTQTVTPNSSSSAVTFGKGNKSVRVSNTGANIGYFRTGLAADGTVTATSADMPVLAGATVVIEKPQDHDTLAHISSAGSTFVITAGEGGS